VFSCAILRIVTIYDFRLLHHLSGLGEQKCKLCLFTVCNIHFRNCQLFRIDGMSYIVHFIRRGGIQMKIVCLLASPRPRGNSTAIAMHFCETAEKKGASIQTFALNKLNYRGCQACMTCKTKLDRCVLKDDLTEVLDAIRDADVLVMATPVYYGEVSSQLKAFIDRTFSYLVPDYTTNPVPSRLKSGKRLVFIQTQGQSDEKQFADIFPRYDYFFNWYGFKDNCLIRGCGLMNGGEAQTRSEIMDEAEKTADMLVQQY